MKSKGSWRKLSKTSSGRLSPKLVHEVRPFIHAQQKINVTTRRGFAGRFRDQRVIVSHDALSARAEDSQRYHRTLFRTLRKVLIGNQCWPWGDERAETERRLETTK
jgi:hypothetical protein